MIQTSSYTEYMKFRNSNIYFQTCKFILTLYLDATVAIDVAMLEIHCMRCSSSYHIFHNNKHQNH